MLRIALLPADWTLWQLVFALLGVVLFYVHVVVVSR